MYAESPFQVTVDAEPVRGRGDVLDGVLLRLRVGPRDIGARRVPQVRVGERVQRRELGRRVARDSGDDAMCLEHGHGATGLDQLPGRAQSRDAAADDCDVDVDVVGETRMVGRRRRLDPVRLVRAGQLVHLALFPLPRRFTPGAACVG